MSTSKTIARDLPNGDYIEVTAEERDGSTGLSGGFSVTAALWEKRGRIDGRARKRMGRDGDAGGQLHPDILDAFPHLAPLVHVHLADPTGLPMHAQANGWYFYSGKCSAYERRSIAEGRDYGYSRLLETPDHDRAAQALHITPADLPEGLDEAGFSAFVASLEDRYLADAQAAREVLAALVDGEGVA